MGIGFDHSKKPKALLDVYQQLRQEERKERANEAESATLEQLRREARDLERRYLTSLSFPWPVWWPIVTATDERGMLANVEPTPEPDLSVYGYDKPVCIQSAYDPAAPDIVRDVVFDWLAQVPSVPGIACFKLGSNGWWHVTAAEACSAIELLGEQEPAKVPGWDRWVEFLRLARDRDGFIVS